MTNVKWRFRMLGGGSVRKRVVARGGFDRSRAPGRSLSKRAHLSFPEVGDQGDPETNRTSRTFHANERKMGHAIFGAGPVSGLGRFQSRQIGFPRAAGARVHRVSTRRQRPFELCGSAENLVRTVLRLRSYWEVEELEPRSGDVPRGNVDCSDGCSRQITGEPCGAMLIRLKIAGASRSALDAGRQTVDSVHSPLAQLSRQLKLDNNHVTSRQPRAPWLPGSLAAWPPGA